MPAKVAYRATYTPYGEPKWENNPLSLPTHSPRRVGKTDTSSTTWRNQNQPTGEVRGTSNEQPSGGGGEGGGPSMIDIINQAYEQEQGLLGGYESDVKKNAQKKRKGMQGRN